MFKFFKKSLPKKEAKKTIELKSIQYEAKIVLAWAKAIEGDQLIQLGLKEMGYPELFHATEAIYLRQNSRDWLIENGFQGKVGQTIPNMTDEYIQTVSDRYIELFENIIGEKFIKADISDINSRIEKNVVDYLTKN